MTRSAVHGRAARSGYYVVAAAENARGLSIPAPVGGWDAISPLAAMGPKSAITMVNVFPQPGYLEIRKGHTTHMPLGSNTSAVESLMAYNALDAADDKLLAIASTSIYDITVVTTASATLTAAHTGISSARFQHINVSVTGGNYLWMVNGVDDPIIYDGTAFSSASITGAGTAGIAAAAVFKNRIWFAENDLMSPAYLEVDAIQGTATRFDVEGVFNKGGYLQAIGSWTLDGGDGPDDVLALVTSKGEVALYTGSGPEAQDFALRGVFEMGAPIGRRCLNKVGADLAVVCIDGVVPLSKVLGLDRAAAFNATITKAIQPVMNQSARDYGANFGWQLISYPRGTRAILNVPITTGVQQEQYVMNTVTGAWCRFTGENANCWAVFKDRLFYGGNAGRVYEADCQGVDEDSSFDYDVETAFNYCGIKGRLKQFTMARSLLTTDGRLLPGIALNVDFGRDVPVDPITIESDPLSLWDVANWDEGVWPTVTSISTDWVTVSGIGYCASIRAKGTVSSDLEDSPGQPLTLQFNGWDLLVRDGGFL